MEFLVDFEINIPENTPPTEVTERQAAEAYAAAKLIDEGHLVRVWKRGNSATVDGLYRAETRPQLDSLTAPLPPHEWMHITVTPLEPHPNDPTLTRMNDHSARLAAPDLTLVYRLEPGLGQPQDLGKITAGHRRIVPLTGGTFTGPS